MEIKRYYAQKSVFYAIVLSKTLHAAWCVKKRIL